VVMNQGVIEQVGAPSEIYRAPATPFAADFVGHMTFLDAVATGPSTVRVGALELAVAGNGALKPGTPVRLAMRPEDVRTRGIEADTPNRFDARIARIAFLGSFCRAQLAPTASPGTTISADFSTNAMRDLGIAEGETRTVAFPPESLRVFAARESA
jgi:iron(III) transport system ATP-binding protein